MAKQKHGRRYQFADLHKTQSHGRFAVKCSLTKENIGVLKLRYKITVEGARQSNRSLPSNRQIKK